VYQEEQISEYFGQKSVKSSHLKTITERDTEWLKHTYVSNPPEFLV